MVPDQAFGEDMKRNPRSTMKLRALIGARPTVGTLMDMCEGSYGLLMKLAPGLASLSGIHRSRTEFGPDLHLDVLEQSRHTTLIRLTHSFAAGEAGVSDPDLRLRVYHDARQVEVEGLNQTALPLDRLYHHPALEQKWRVNQFLARWLAFCLSQGHGFSTTDAGETQARAGGEATVAA